MIKLRFLPDAETEFLKEVMYYSATGTGIGIKFQQAVEDTVRRAVAVPSGGAPAPNGTRRRPVKGFPFSVIYRPSATEILIVALVHHRRKPGYWLRRIQKPK